MECERQEQEQEHHPQDLDQLQMEEQTRNINGDLFVKVMSDEQMEDLRKQIAAFATICKQLEELLRSLTFQTDPTTGFMFRNPYCTPLMASSHHHHHHHHHGNKIPRRQRWNPTSEQLQILERMFDQGNETPSKDKVKGITSELAKHGQIAETNVYNWFQNRRARLKKKQQMSSSAISETNNNDQSETEMAIESSNGEKSKDSELVTCENFSKKVSVEDSIQQQQQPMFPVEASLKAADGGGESFGQIDLHGRMLSKTKWDHLHEDMAAVNPEYYYPYVHHQNYTSLE